MFEREFCALEEAIDAHPVLVRPPGAEPTMCVNREGFALSIEVKVGRKRPRAISGYGASARAALDDLLGSLDSWAVSI